MLSAVVSTTPGIPAACECPSNLRRTVQFSEKTLLCEIERNDQGTCVAAVEGDLSPAETVTMLLVSGALTGLVPAENRQTKTLTFPGNGRSQENETVRVVIGIETESPVFSAAICAASIGNPAVKVGSVTTDEGTLALELQIAWEYRAAGVEMYPHARSIFELGLALGSLPGVVSINGSCSEPFLLSETVTPAV